MQRRSAYGNVGQLDSLSGPAQHKPAATHVATADKIRRKQQPLPEDLKQRSGVFRTRDTAEQYVRTGAFRMPVQEFRSFFQRIAKNRIGFIDRNFRDRAELLDIDRCVRRNQTGAGHHHQGGRKSGRSRAKRLRIGHLPAKIQAADETVDFADSSAALPEPSRQIEACVLAHEQ